MVDSGTKQEIQASAERALGHCKRLTGTTDSEFEQVLNGELYCAATGVAERELNGLRSYVMGMLDGIGRVAQVGFEQSHEGLKALFDHSCQMLISGVFFLGYKAGYSDAVKDRERR